MPLSQGSASVTEGSGSGGGGGGGVTYTTIYDPASPKLLPQGSDATTFLNAVPTAAGATNIANRPATVNLSPNLNTGHRLYAVLRQGTTNLFHYTVSMELQILSADEYSPSNQLVLCGPVQAHNANSGDPKWVLYVEIDTDSLGSIVVGCIDEPDLSLIRLMQEG